MFRIVDRGGAVVAASAAVVCLATLSWVVAGGNAARDRHPGGYVVVGGADPSGSASSSAIPSNGTVTLVPGDQSADASATAADAEYGAVPTTRASGHAGVHGARGHHGDASPSPAGASPSGSRSPSAHPSTVTSASPDASPSLGGLPLRPGPLTVSAPSDAADGHNWCEDVTVTFGNSGSAPVTSGRATFRTAVVGPLGFVWGVYPTTVDAPLPLAAGARVTTTYDLCLSPWQVPPGLRMKTTGVTLVA